MDERLTDLEIKVAYVERTVAELDGVVRDLGDKLELLRREVIRLRETQEPATPPADKPPHY